MCIHPNRKKKMRFSRYHYKKFKIYPSNFFFLFVNTTSTVSKLDNVLIHNLMISGMVEKCEPVLRPPGTPQDTWEHRNPRELPGTLGTPGDPLELSWTLKTLSNLRDLAEPLQNQRISLGPHWKRNFLYLRNYNFSIIKTSKFSIVCSWAAIC